MKLFFWLFLFLAGCLVTEKVEFKEEENLPPALSDEPGSATPIGEIIKIDLSDEELKEVTFSLQVRDQNVLQNLQARYKLFTRDTEIPIEIGLEVGISGDPIRYFEFNIPVSVFADDSCYWLQLAVTSEFENDPNIWDKPSREGDIAKARWLIVTGSASIDDCPVEAVKEYNPGEASP